MSYKTNQDLESWIESRKLVSEVYPVTKQYPQTELYGLVNQMRRSAISIPSNIAEGCGRNHRKDSIQFFYMSRSSLYELETQLFLSFDLGFRDEQRLKSFAEA